jgi:DNA polymerase V
MENSVLEIPLYAGIRQIGIPSTAAETAARHVDLNNLIKHPDATFLIRHKDLSMINAFIPPEALLVVDRSITPHNNSIVLANVNGTLTIRYLKKNDYKTILVAANPKYPETKITAGINFAILGVVIQVISDPSKLGNVC